MTESEAYEIFQNEKLFGQNVTGADLIARCGEVIVTLAIAYTKGNTAGTKGSLAMLELLLMGLRKTEQPTLTHANFLELAIKDIKGSKVDF